MAQISVQKHTVDSGETITSIATKYRVTTYQLQQANPDISNGIKVNDVLHIPQPDSVSANPKEYIIKRGDTKFSLAKRFGLTIEALEFRNPEIISSFQEGQILNVSNEITSEPHIKNNHNNREAYVVTRLDTKFGLAKKFNTSIAELERINPHIIRMLQEGQTITIPVTNRTKLTEDQPQTKNSTYQLSTPVVLHEKTNEEATAPISNDAVVVAKKQSEITINEQLQNQASTARHTTNISSKRTNLSPVFKSTKQRRLLFFLPFSQLEYDAHNTDDNFDKVLDTFEKSNLEFYRGASIAIDSIKKLGLKLDVSIVEAKNGIQNLDLKTLTETKNISSFDAVILPYYDTIDKSIAAEISVNNIPVISGSHKVNQYPSNNLYSALPSTNQQRKKILDYITSEKGNMIVISDVDRDESRTFIVNHAPNASIIHLRKNGTFNSDELIKKFKKDQVNYVIIDSERNSVFINTTNILLSALSKYTIQIAVLEANLVPNKNDVSIKRYKILKMLYPSFTSAEKTPESLKFSQTYLKKHSIMPTANVLKGFDITMDSLLRILQEQSFQNSAENQVTVYTHLKFEYEKNANGGYSNQGLYILHYDTGSDVKEIN